MKPKFQLLIVDESTYVAGILTQTLEKDFEITVVNTGQDAARLLIQGNRYDCVLTELNLPFFSGLEITKLIRMSKLIAHTPIVILSSATSSDTRIECLEQGVDSFISKPFNPLEVKAKLNALLRRTVPQTDERMVADLDRAEPKSAWQPKSRFLSIFSRGYSVSQSA
ncbi:response regulator [Rudanella paleaurantiibacter]|uniref:Response regulator n=1 Tax=Rudanella paleaurantiibacter TaxID=2614655 RepID=A0A7J5TWZ0_9BACT|nr:MULTISPECIES: response regulator [Rudanella]KAB7729158.1 response regulator [Rudanella paleaurantiibacter]